MIQGGLSMPSDEIEKIHSKMSRLAREIIE